RGNFHSADGTRLPTCPISSWHRSLYSLCPLWLRVYESRSPKSLSGPIEILSQIPRSRVVPESGNIRQNRNPTGPAQDGSDESLQLKFCGRHTNTEPSPAFLRTPRLDNLR